MEIPRDGRCAAQRHLHVALFTSSEPCQLQLWVARTVRILIHVSKSWKTYVMPGKLNAQQSEPQQAGLNMHAN